MQCDLVCKKLEEVPAPSEIPRLVCGLGGALSGMMAIPGAPILGLAIGSLSGRVGRIPFSRSGE